MLILFWGINTGNTGYLYAHKQICRGVESPVKEYLEVQRLAELEGFLTAKMNPAHMKPRDSYRAVDD